MVKINKNFKKLKKNYLFSEIEKKAKNYPKKDLINLGIGDVAHPISPFITKEIQKASFELENKKTFKGYCPSEGEFFLRKEIKKNDYKHLNIQEDEIFISPGMKNNLSSIQELFSPCNTVALPDPAYPVYLDSNILAGRNISFLKCLKKNNFLPMPPNQKYDIIYLCSPHNPTGCAFTYNMLQKWIDYAKNHSSIILYDGAYSSFITQTNIPRSVYEIQGAKDVAIEFKSFSKSAGFASLRLSYCIIPKQIKKDGISLNSMWKRLIDTKFGAVSYPIQKAGWAIFKKNAQEDIKRVTSIYLQNAKLLKKGLEAFGFSCFGGINSPYIWCKFKNFSSMELFDLLLDKTKIITIPGSGFGKEGEGFVRFSSFAQSDDIAKVIIRIRSYFT